MGFWDTAKTVGKYAALGPLGAQGLLAKKGLDHVAGKMGDDAESGIPDYNAPELDAATRGLQDQQSARANQSVEDIAGESLAGTEQAGGLLPQYSVGDDSLKQALNRRTQKSFQGDMNKMKAQAETRAYSEKSKRLNAVAQTQNQMNQWQHGVEMQKYQVQQAKKQARNEAMQSVFGTVGTLGGAAVGAFAGGPAGAGVGANMGKTLGGGMAPMAGTALPATGGMPNYQLA